MATEEEELVRDFTRVRETSASIVVEVMVVDWPSPSEPRGTWAKAASIPISSDRSEIERARKAVLRNRRYFRRCKECGERQLKGYMWATDVCMSCAESNFGIIF
jgi:hypothetical protein